MGYNTKHFDHDSYYASRSTKELEVLLRDATNFADKNPEFKDGWHNEYVQSLRAMIAERIGSKK